MCFYVDQKWFRKFIINLQIKQSLKQVILLFITDDYRKQLNSKKSRIKNNGFLFANWFNLHHMNVNWPLFSRIYFFVSHLYTNFLELLFAYFISYHSGINFLIEIYVYQFTVNKSQEVSKLP